MRFDKYQHDETFLVTKGTLRFHALNGATVDAKLGDYVTVPPRSPHTFSNPYDEEAKFFNTYTPAFYINYFKLLAKLGEAGKPMNPEANRRAMAVSTVLSCRLPRRSPKRCLGPELTLAFCSTLLRLAWRTMRCRWTRSSSMEMGMRRRTRMRRRLEGRDRHHCPRTYVGVSNDVKETM